MTTKKKKLKCCAIIIENFHFQDLYKIQKQSKKILSGVF